MHSELSNCRRTPPACLTLRHQLSILSCVSSCPSARHCLTSFSTVSQAFVSTKDFCELALVDSQEVTSNKRSAATGHDAKADSGIHFFVSASSTEKGMPPPRPHARGIFQCLQKSRTASPSE